MITPAILIVHRDDVLLSLIGYCWLLLPNKVTDWLKNYKLTDRLSYFYFLVCDSVVHEVKLLKLS